MTPAHSFPAPLLILIPLIAWRIYVRIRRAVGRQRLSKYRVWITMGIYTLILVAIGLGTRAHPERLGWMVVGLALGIPLGVFSLKKTKFEPTPEGLFYTPNAHLGIILSMLFVGRILYRIFAAYLVATSKPQDPGDFMGSAATVAIFGLLAGYYITYAVGLARWRYRIIRNKRQREALKLAGATAEASLG
jgi:hypothetical protein